MRPGFFFHLSKKYKYFHADLPKSVSEIKLINTFTRPISLFIEDSIGLKNIVKFLSFFVF